VYVIHKLQIIAVIGIWHASLQGHASIYVLQYICINSISNTEQNFVCGHWSLPTLLQPWLLLPTSNFMFYKTDNMLALGRFKDALQVSFIMQHQIIIMSLTLDNWHPAFRVLHRWQPVIILYHTAVHLTLPLQLTQLDCLQTIKIRWTVWQQESSISSPHWYFCLYADAVQLGKGWFRLVS